MLKIGLILLSSIFLVSCGSTKSYQDLYPKALSKGVEFEMSFEDFSKLRNVDANNLNEESFRITYVEEVNSENVEHIAYYFDKDGDKPLYEMIFIYKDTVTRNTDAEALLGKPNNGEEWLLEMKPYNLMAWKFRKKLILAALIPGTEWAEEVGN